MGNREPLGGVQRGTGRVAADGFDGALDQEDVGFLAGFEDAELGVDRSLFRHNPIGSWFRAARTALDVQPGGPPLIRSQVLVDFGETEDERIGRIWLGLVAGEFGPAGVEVGEVLISEVVRRTRRCTEDV